MGNEVGKLFDDRGPHNYALITEAKYRKCPCGCNRYGTQLELV
jgi:hypothetical protein